MRNLLYVPILHTEADLGSAAAAVSKHTVAATGEKRWVKHGKVVRRFWQGIADYLLSLDPKALRIYQDGLAADGAAVLGVLEKAASRGSPNYQLLLELVRRGAVLRKAEDPSLLLAERQILLDALDKPGETATSMGVYRAQRDRLLTARDRFIAKTVGETLEDGETGVLFLGALHEALTYLPPDIEVKQLKSQETVRAYFLALLSEQDESSWEALAQVLCSHPADQRR